MIKQPFRIRRKKPQSSADPHRSELEHGVPSQAIWTLAASASSGTPWVREPEQLTVQMQMVSVITLTILVTKYQGPVVS